MISINDDASQSPSVVVRVNNGTLTVSGAGSATITDNATSSVTIYGSVADINEALDGLQYEPTLDWNGSDTLTISTTDGEIYALNIDANLQAYYEFTGGSAGIDSSPAGGNNLVKSGNAVVTTDGVRGDVLSLDGSGDYASVSGLVTTSQQLTFSSWVNLSAGASTSEIIDMGYLISIRVDATNGVQGSYWDGSIVRETTSGISLDGDGWHHVAYTIDSTADTQTIYVDGVAIATTSHVNDISFSGGTGITRIGATTQSSSNYFNGQIDEARIYDRALTANEITSLANAPAQISDTDTVIINVTPLNDAPVANADPGNYTNDLQALNPLGYWRLGDSGDSGDTATADLGSTSNPG